MRRIDTVRDVFVPPLPEKSSAMVSDLHRMLAASTGGVTVTVQTSGTDHSSPFCIELPKEVLAALTDMLKAMADGHAVTVVPRGRELSTAEAADFLNVSRPFVVKEMDSGRLPHRKVGAHRRVAFDDLIRYFHQMRAQQDDALQELSDLTRELGLEY